jgi:hypothetical protein
MGGFLKLLRSRTPRIHPPMEDLVEWADGSAQPGTGRHLERCAVCRAHALSIRRASQKAREDEIGPSELSALALALARLQTRMRAWPGNWQRHARNPAHARLTRTIELYFGREAASRMAKASGGSEPERHLVQVMKPMFSAFLGAAAADALAEQIAGAEC